MIVATSVLSALVVLLSVVAYRQGGKHLTGWRSGLRTMWKFLPLLLAAFFLVGMLQVAVPSEFVRRWLGSVIGAAIPVGPYVIFPIIAGLHSSGASIGTIVALISGWTLWSSGRIPYELALVGPKFILIRIASAAVFPPLIGLAADLLF